MRQEPERAGLGHAPPQAQGGWFRTSETATGQTPNHGRLTVNPAAGALEPRRHPLTVVSKHCSPPTLPMTQMIIGAVVVVIWIWTVVITWAVVVIGIIVVIIGTVIGTVIIGIGTIQERACGQTACEPTCPAPPAG